jgi:hypothetical protein
MKKTLLSAVAIAGVAGAFAVPTMVSGNARRTEGSLSALQAAETPFLAELSGANEVPGPGDADGSGTAAVSFDPIDATTTEVCFDLAYTGIAAPTAAHIHTGAAGASGAVLIDFGAPTPDSYSGCVDAPTADVDLILANPAGFYVNVHNGDFPNGAIRGQLAEGPGSAGSMHFLPAPLRAYDSRLAPNTELDAMETRTISLSNGTDLEGDSVMAVPPGATAAIITLTATETGGPGYLSVYSNAVPSPAPGEEPATSNLNFTVAGLSVAVGTQVAVDPSGSIKVTAGPASTHFIVDVVGYLY